MLKFRKFGLLYALITFFSVFLVFTTGCSYSSETFVLTKNQIEIFLNDHKTINSKFDGYIFDDKPEDINQFLCSKEVKTQNLINGVVAGFFRDLIQNEDPNCKVRIDKGNNGKWFKFTFLNNFQISSGSNIELKKGLSFRVDRYNDYFKINLNGSYIETNTNSVKEISFLHNSIFDDKDMVMQDIYENDSPVPDATWKDQHWSYVVAQKGYDSSYFSGYDLPRHELYVDYCPSSFFQYTHAINHDWGLSLHLMLDEFPNLKFSTQSATPEYDGDKEHRGKRFYFDSADIATPTGHQDLFINLQKVNPLQFEQPKNSDTQDIDYKECYTITSTTPGLANNFSISDANVGIKYESSTDPEEGFKAKLSWGDGGQPLPQGTHDIIITFKLKSAFYTDQELKVNKILHVNIQ